MTKKRLPELSYMNVLFCMLVILIHVISYPVSELAAGTLKYSAVMLIWRFISFVVQGFVFLSGLKMFLGGRENAPYVKYLGKRVLRILVPYLFAFVAYYIFYFTVYDYPLDAAFITKHLVHGSLVSHLYYVPLILQFDLLMPLWRKIVGRCPAYLVVPFSLILSMIFESAFPTMLQALFPKVSFVYNDRLFTTYLAYFLMGAYAGKHYDGFCDMIKKSFAVVAALFGTATVLCGVYSYIAFNNFAYIPHMSQIHFLYVVSAIIFTFALSQRIPEGFSRLWLVKEIDGASYYIYLWHMLALFFANFLLGKLSITAQAPAFFIRAVITYGITILLCILYVKIKKKFSKR